MNLGLDRIYYMVPAAQGLTNQELNTLFSLAFVQNLKTLSNYLAKQANSQADCLLVVFIHLKVELPTQFPPLNEKKCFYNQ